MKKNCFLFLLAIVTLLTVCGCKQVDAINPSKISAEHFTEGEHPRDEEYAASFRTKYVALDGLNIHFAETIFDETVSPALAKQIAADYAALTELDNRMSKPVDIYLVGETETGNPVTTSSGLFCTPKSVQNGIYRPFLTSCTFDLIPWWQCVGLSQTVFEESAVSADELSVRLEDYYSKSEKSYLLTLSPLYFIENFTDEETRDLAAQSAQSLTAYILSQNDMNTFLTDGNNMDYRREWLKDLGITVDTENISTPEAAYISTLPLICAKDIPFVIEEHNFQLNLQSVDWMPTADDVSYFLVNFYSDVDPLYSYLEENAPKFYNTLQQFDVRQSSLSVFDSDAGDHSFAEPDGRKAVILNPEAAVHELTHCLMPINDPKERRWLSEGLVTYLTAPYLSYRDDSQLIDSFSSEDAVAKLSGIYLQARNEVAGIYEQLTGQDISNIYQEEHPFFLIYQAIGYEVVLHPETLESINFPLAQTPIDKRGKQPSGYIGNQLSYPQAMVFVQYLVEKYGLDTMIEAEMDTSAYHKLFPDAAAFQKEYDNFVAQIDFD